MTEVLRFIGRGGEEARPRPENLGRDLAVAIFSSMVLLRTFDERAVALQRQGRIGTYPPFWGEEATQAGPVHACSPRDWLFPSYRQGAVGLLRGVPASTPLKYRRGMGGPYGFWNPRAHRVAPICIPIGTHLPHAVGLAMASRFTGSGEAALVWFGDGATSEGDFHEAMNFASVFEAPVVFFCVNNRWAISTPFERQTATATVAEKAAAYAMPSIRVDGFDAVACFHATAEALARARAGGGPSLIEADSYRIGGHATADDPSLYRDESEARQFRDIEPVGRMASWLRAAGMLDEAAEQDIRRAAARQLADAVVEMEAAGHPDPNIMFDYVYASELPRPLAEAAQELDPLSGVDTTL